MSDTMRAQPFERLLSWVLGELEQSGSIFGIHRSMFYTPKPDSLYSSQIFGQPLATPIGPAAGPHTQLAQNILCAWLSGGRFIELKTVQILDELEIPRPCIDMEDEGYNVEWSQELKLEQSASEYVKAWALIHILHRLLGFEGRLPLGTVFNMSVGYNLAGITSEPMLRFMDRLTDAAEEIHAIRAILRRHFPQFADVEIPRRLTDNVTLSTMHGCPPDEIERIATYLLQERGLHTTVKLNPTLLGKETVLAILHDRLGFTEIDIPDAVFEHDLKYGRAVELIRTLQQKAAERGLVFGVKLSNTLAMANRKGYLPGSEMYMSGRALYPVTMELFLRLSREFLCGASSGSGQGLKVSYSAGADAFNVTAILAAGARPVTAASDLLKPGGYSRLLQYLETLQADMCERGASNLDELARDRLTNLERAAAQALQNPRYRKQYHPYGLPNVPSSLGLFDCVAAPCVERCAVCQDVPEYAWLIAQGEYDRALAVILARNPLPAVTGYVCTHLCQTGCTRNNYDEPVGIRDLKRFAAEFGSLDRGAETGEQGSGNQELASGSQIPAPGSQIPSARVAVVGSGPSGLAAAYFLALNGVRVTLFEAREYPGGMLAIAGRYRLPAEVVQADIDRVLRLGVELKLNHRITAPLQELFRQGFSAVYIACGLQRDATLDIEGIDGCGVFTALRFLEQVAGGEWPDLGQQVLVIGGGNTAVDVARTAARLVGRPVTVVYRRSRAEMPAGEEEVVGLLDEGDLLEELASPCRIVLEGGHVVALECIRNRLGEPAADGRGRPTPIPGSEFRLLADSVILAIGQAPDVGFLRDSGIPARADGTVVTDADGRILLPAVPAPAPALFAGGDLACGPAIIIEACADGRRAAQAICRELGLDFRPPPAAVPELNEQDILCVKRARARQEPRLRPRGAASSHHPLAGFELVEQTLSETSARAEAARCLQCSVLCDKCVEVCPNRANYPYHVEPVRWTLPLLACHDGVPSVVGQEEFAVLQARQILHLDDSCNECGNCATFCVHQGRPYADKPRLFLDEAGFLDEADNAFYLEGESLRRRERGREVRLSRTDGGFEYEDASLRARLSTGMEVQDLVLKQSFEGTVSLRPAAEMAVLLAGISRCLPFLQCCREPGPR